MLAIARITFFLQILMIAPAKNGGDAKDEGRYQRAEGALKIMRKIMRNHRHRHSKLISCR